MKPKKSKLLTPEKNILIKLVGRGNIYNLRYTAEAFGYSNPYDADECEHHITETITDKLIIDILDCSDEDIDYVIAYLRDEAYIDI